MESSGNWDETRDTKDNCPRSVDKGQTISNLSVRIEKNVYRIHRRSNTPIEDSPLGPIDHASVYRPLRLRDAMQHSFNLALYVADKRYRFGDNAQWQHANIFL